MEYGDNHTGSVSSIGTGNDGNLVSVQYHNTDNKNKSNKYYNEGASGGEMAVLSLNGDKWEKVDSYHIDGNDMTHIQGVCQNGNDCWFASSSSGGDSVLHYATLDGSTNTVKVIGSINVPAGAESICVEGDKVFVTHEGKGLERSQGNGYVTVYNSNELKKYFGIEE